MKMPIGRDVQVMADMFPPILWNHAVHCYSMGHRGYHTFDHAQDVMQRVLWLESEIGFMNFKAAMMAALYHDAVYIPGASTGHNELKSYEQLAQVFAYTNQRYTDSDDLKKAEVLILATSKHLEQRSTLTDWDTALFMDCDMLGFADSEERFDAQNKLIDVEFGQDSNNLTNLYVSGRISFLKVLKNRGVFISPPIRRHFEDKALANIDRELDRMRESVANVYHVPGGTGDR